jgi:heptosyltransferase-2
MVPLSAAGRLAMWLARRDAPLDPTLMRRIAFVKLDHLGDLVMSSPLLAAVKEWAPQARLTLVTRPANTVLAERLWSVDEVAAADVPWIRPEPGWRENLGACLGLARELKDGNYDLVIDLRYHNRLDSLLLSLCGAAARLGFDAGGFGFGLTHRARWPAGGHEVDRLAGALEEFGIRVRDRRPEFPLSADEMKKGKAVAGRNCVAVHPGAGNAVKRWMPERFAWVARELARKAGARIAVLGGPGEEDLGGPIVRALPRNRVLDLRGRLRLPEMAAVLANCRLFIGNDGGAGHVAAAVGTPALIVFSGTSTGAEWAPRGPHVRRVEKSVPCKPCHRADCPYDQACLRKAGVDEVLSAALAMLHHGYGPSSALTHTLSRRAGEGYGGKAIARRHGGRIGSGRGRPRKD